MPGNTPAAFYRNQYGLAFSSSDTLSPAMVGKIPKRVLFYLGKLPGDDNTGALTPLLALKCLEPSKDADHLNSEDFGLVESNRVRAEPVEIADATQDWDGCYAVTVDGAIDFKLYYTLDGRRSRLLQKTPADGAYFKIVGFAPEPFFEMPIERWWLEFTAKNTLVHSCLDERVASLVVRNQKSKIYDWGNFEFKRAKKAETISVGKRKFSAVFSEAFGYLASPEPGQHISFMQNLGMSETDGISSEYELDWLDFTLKVQFEDREETIMGFSAALPPETSYRIVNDNGELYCSSLSGKLFVAETVEGAIHYTEVNRVPLSYGKKFAMGGMLLEYCEG